MKHIILVEDDEAIREVFNMLFSNNDFRITSFENGNQIFKDELETPDLFLLDKRISGVDGLDLCRYIKQNEKLKHVPVIIISANAHIKELAKVAGADDAISKPFSISDLRAIVTKYTS